MAVTIRLRALGSERARSGDRPITAQPAFEHRLTGYEAAGTVPRLTFLEHVTRTGRVDRERLRAISPRFIAQYEAAQSPTTSIAGVRA
jgi:hypothetical protein